MRRKLILSSLALAVSVLPPLIAVISYFPVWSSRGSGAVLSGFAALLAVLSAMPLFKLLSRLLSSPSAWMMWLITFIVFFALSRIVNEMLVISLVGTLSNIVGAVLFRAAAAGEKKK